MEVLELLKLVQVRGADVAQVVSARRGNLDC